MSTQHVADWWRTQATRRHEGTVEFLEGLSAYAMNNAAAEDALAASWTTKWQHVRARAEDFLKTTELKEICDLYPPTVVQTNEANPRLSDGIVPTFPLSEAQVELALDDPLEDDDEWS